MLKSAIILLLFAFSATCLKAQDNIDITDINEQTETGLEMSKSPTSALWRSVIPGWGQYYNEEYWKAPLLFGSAVGLGSLIYYFNSEYSDYSDQLEIATKKGTKIPIDSPEDLGDTFNPIKKKLLSDLEIRQLKANREVNRDSRDMMAFYLLGVYIISAVDAYVGAHLYDFNVDDELSYNLRVNSQGLPEISFNYSF